MIDSHGRIVFDSSDDSGDVAPAPKDVEQEGEEVGEDEEKSELQKEASSVEKTAPAAAEEDLEDVEIDVAALGMRFFPDLNILDTLDICPSLKTFELGDPDGSMDIPFLKAPEDWRHEQGDRSSGLGDKSGMFIDDDNPLGFDDEVDLGVFNLPDDVNFGEGGEAWAREAALEPQMHVFNGGAGGGDDVGGDRVEMLDVDGDGDYIVTMDHRQKDRMHEDILGYFDQALQKNWTSAEHWRIRKIKDNLSKAQAGPTRQRKEKEPFEIDFSSPLDPSLADLTYTQSSSNLAICMPKKDWKSKSRNLLPDDKHFSSRQLLSLFLKPKARLGRKMATTGGFGMGGGSGQQPAAEVADRDMDEAFWASHKGLAAEGKAAAGGGDDSTVVPQGDYDANFFQDDAGAGDNDDQDEFADAKEHQGGADGVMGANDSPDQITHDPGLGFTAMMNTTYQMAFGTQLVTQTRRVRPEYVQYARVAKKVDVRRLKEEIWKGMGLENLTPVGSRVTRRPQSIPWACADGLQLQDANRSRLPTPPEEEGTASGQSDNTVATVKGPPPGADPTLRFTSIMNDLQAVYPRQVMDDISTSYCFICLLHLANEKGLIITKTEGLNELDIRKDWSAEITVGGD